MSKRTGLTVGMILLALTVLFITLAEANATAPQLTVDGVTYSPSQVSGPTNHYETPDTNPIAAFSDRHVWQGNGSDNLPCEGGIHWIDNKNLLTVSHCLTSTTVTTTTTVPQSTTTTVPETTTSSSTSTTTPEVSTTVTVPEVTTTTISLVTSTSVPPTTTIPEELPYTGPGEVLLGIALVGLGILGIGMGLLALYAAETEQE